jgi:hypothetical protein
MISGSSKDRRKYSRLLKDISRDLQADVKPLPIPISKTPWWKTSWGVVVIFATLLGIAGWPEIADIYNPRFSVNLGPTLFASDVFGTSLVVRNTGHFDAWDVRIICSPEMRGQITMNRVEIGSPIVPLLEHGGPGATVSCWGVSLETLPVNTVLTIDLSVSGKYGFKWFNRNVSKTYPFIAGHLPNGQVTFVEEP